MPEIQKVIADTSVLIAFEKLELLDLLCSVYDQVLLPVAVFSEYSNEMRSCFAAAQAPDGLSNLLEKEGGLGRGESEAIALGYTSGVTILVDDLKARKAARTLGCQMSGTIGVLVKMERRGLISSAYEEMRKLKKMGFRISDRLLDKFKNPTSHST
jgi:predicted nucleic acid-binding protein